MKSSSSYSLLVRVTTKVPPVPYEDIRVIPSSSYEENKKIINKNKRKGGGERLRRTNLIIINKKSTSPLILHSIEQINIFQYFLNFEEEEKKEEVGCVWLLLRRIIINK